MDALTTTQSEILHVPGARFYYEVRGSGPVLLMRPGGPAEGGIFHAVGSGQTPERFLGVADVPNFGSPAVANSSLSLPFSKTAESIRRSAAGTVLESHMRLPLPSTTGYTQS